MKVDVEDGQWQLMRRVLERAEKQFCFKKRHILVRWNFVCADEDLYLPSIKGRILLRRLSSCVPYLLFTGLQSDHTVHMVRGVATNTTAGNARASDPVEDLQFSGGRPHTPLIHDGFGGSWVRGLFGTGYPDFEQVLEQWTQSPNRRMEIIQYLINHPDIWIPRIAHLLNEDPSTLQQIWETARSPGLMQETMRVEDRAMSNIEASPGGFNTLRQSYETSEEQRLNEAAMSGNICYDGRAQTRDQSTNPSTTGSDRSTSSQAPNTNPLPNPWTSAGGPQRITTTWSTLDGNTHTITPGNGGLGLYGFWDPGLYQLLDGMQDLFQPNHVMKNSDASQAMQSIHSNPQDMNQQMLSLQQSPLYSLGPQPSTQEQGHPGTGTDNTGLNAGLNAADLLKELCAGIATGQASFQNAADVLPEELYASQLSQLQEMGFFDTHENIRALSATEGDVLAAVRILGGLGQ